MRARMAVMTVKIWRESEGGRRALWGWFPPAPALFLSAGLLFLGALLALWLGGCTEPNPRFRGAGADADMGAEDAGGDACGEGCPVGSAFEGGEEAEDSCLSDGVILADEGGDFGVCVREEGCHGLCRFALPCPCGLERLYPVTCARCP